MSITKEQEIKEIEMSIAQRWAEKMENEEYEEIGTKQMISICLMVFFACIACFLLGYYFAYEGAINEANRQLVELYQDASVLSGQPNSIIFPNITMEGFK